LGDSPSAVAVDPEVVRITAYFQKMLPARYMEKNCTNTTYAGYPTTLPLKLCNYQVRDTHFGVNRHALVVLLDAAPPMLATWVVHAVTKVKGKVTPSANDALAKQVIEASGAQFPVAGVVFEDMDGSGQRVFPFRHGVTVHIEDLPYYDTIQPTDAQLHRYLTGSVSQVMKYARIQSTTREQYVANGGNPQVLKDISLWPGIIRDAYVRAWEHDGNDGYEMMVAWAKANL